MKSMKTSNAIAENTFWILRHVDQLIQADTQYWPEIQRILIHTLSQDTLTLAKALVSTGGIDPAGIQICEERGNAASEDFNPPELLSGADLIELGMPPGPAFSKVLKEVRDQQLLGNIKSSEQAVELAKTTYQSLEP